MIDEPEMDHFISAELAASIPGLFAERVARSPKKTAYIEYDPIATQWRSYSWSDMEKVVIAYQKALSRSSLRPGDRVCQMLPNCIEWVAFDIAAMSLGLVPVPIYPHDSVENASYVLANAGARLLVTDTLERWEALSPRTRLSGQVEAVWLKEATQIFSRDGCQLLPMPKPEVTPEEKFERPAIDPDDLATLIYTSGTTGRPKGVMLSHGAILCNAEAASRFIPPLQSDIFLSILPLAHAFERTLGHYLPMMAGATVAYSRSPELFRHDLAIIRPSVLLAVPRLYERIYSAIMEEVAKSRFRKALLSATAEIGWTLRKARQQLGPPPGLARRLLWFVLEPLIARRVMQAFGGRLRVAVSGGASLPAGVSRFLVGMGLPLVEGYGLTEAGPVVTACTVENSIPGTAGWPLGGVQLRIAGDGELQIRTPCLMKGYWQNKTATRHAFTADGWLCTGDLARIETDGRLCIEGRLTDTIVLSTGKKIDLNELEAAIANDPLVDQVSVVGTGRPCPVALIVLNWQRWEALADQQGLEPSRPDMIEAKTAILEQITAAQAGFAEYALIRAVHPVLNPWTVKDGLLTPTLKVKRLALASKYKNEIESLYGEIDRKRRGRVNGAQ